MTVIRTKTPAGEPIVIMSEAEFERLRELAEDAEDIATAARVEAALAAGWEELLTGEELDAMREAPSPLAFWRNKREITLEALAGRVGADLETLAAVDRGERVGDVRLYRRLAEELRVDMEDLVPAA
jgi:DNA-binding XRE family transcriptional regulator